ncbi:NAD(P)H-binding protein [Herbiconiux sp. CPCC 203407]|uniref:NAD(P)H-binding protein n=1 Tax=Herbiconiux oxytropis TaxID=2970915 RepID=A0AA41XIH8_9MICO|nr:NAD(P)H-binding protein [Herbiconiux oxytropis]MCS5723441.1 NAD(P)H-binding protein [Herbiconiux oxytropis]MCS5726528.1 NAD(P)H-binding protein [Herbiconiux oxytropis]
MRIAVAGGTGTVGRHIVEIARSRDHEAVVLSRSEGVDLTNGAELASALAGVEVVIDAASTATQSADESRAFFGAVTTNLLTAGEATGVAHHIALSIVGSDLAPFGYYAGKAEQERLVRAGRVPWTILRATQFHEFAAQILGQVKLGPVGLVPKMVSQPVAAREVAERLVDLAERDPAGLAADLAGPEVLRMRDMVRAYAAATGDRANPPGRPGRPGRPGPTLELPLPGGFGKALRDGTILPAPGADRGTQTFAEWIAEPHGRP